MTSPSDLPGLPEVPAPVTFERVAGRLVRDDWSADDGGATVRRRWPGVEIVATVQRADGVVLLFTGSRLAAAIPLARQRDVEAFVNDWHRERIWPTLLLRASETELAVQAVIAVDGSAGLTEVQLDEYIRVAVGTMHQCFRAFDEAPGIGQPGSRSADPDAR